MSDRQAPSPMFNPQASAATLNEPVDSNPAMRFVLEMAAVALDAPGFEQSAAGLCSDLALKLGCSRVSIGMFEKGKHRVVATSHTVSRPGRQKIFRDIAALMDEASDQSQPVFHPEPDDVPAHIGHVHRAFAQAHGLNRVYTFLLFDHEESFGAITLEWEDEPQRVDIRELIHLSTLAGPVLAAKHKADHPWRHWRRRFFKRLSRRTGWVLGGALLSLLAAATLLLSMTSTHWVKADVSIEPEQKQTVVAPMHGFIERSALRAGDTVTVGQELGRLDRRELELEHEKLSGELQQTKREYRGALAGHDRMQTAVFKARMEQTRAKLALISEQIRRASLVSPIDGYVVSGDLSQLIGTPVNRGDTLFEIAPLDSYRVVLRLDERDAGRVHERQTGSLVLNGAPGEELTLRVKRVTPVAETREGRNYFRVEAELSQTVDHLRPGMTGVARVDAGEATLAWLLTHRLIDWLKLTFWTLEL